VQQEKRMLLGKRKRCGFSIAEILEDDLPKNSRIEEADNNNYRSIGGSEYHF